MVFGVDPILQYHEFNFASDDAVASFTSSSSTKNWPLFKLGGKRPLRNIQALKILEAEIPFSWYLFSTTDVLTIVNTETPATYNMSLGNGNFSANEIVSKWNFMYPAVELSYNENTLKFHIVLDSSEAFTITTNSEKLGYLLGLKAGVVYNSEPGDFFDFPFAAQVTGPNFLYVCSDSIGNLTNMYLPKSASGEGNSGPELAKIQINVGPGDTIFWKDPDPTKYFDVEGVNALTESDFYLRTNVPGLNKVLDLNGLSFSLKLGVIENDLTQRVTYGGLAQNDRVTKRIRAL